MTSKLLPQHAAISRRQFVLGLAAGGVLSGMSSGMRTAFAASHPSIQSPPVLEGSRFDLAYSPHPVNITGRDRFATAINGSVPAPVLRWREGDTVTLNVTNHMAEDTSIHWHGIILPSSQDGVPDISDGFKGIKPGDSFRYRFKVNQSGTYWYHSHSGFQEQTGAYGAIVIDPVQPDPFSYDREYVIVLSDWSDEDPNRIYAKLKKMSDYYNFRERTAGDALSDLDNKGWSGFWAKRGMWNRVRMSDRDLSDVTGYTYTFLMNGIPPADGWIGLFKRGEKVRLRFINAAAMTFFDVRIPGLEMKVVAADGQNIEPVTVEEMRLGVAETYDVIVAPKDDRAYSVFAQAIDRSGYARGTLTPDPSMLADAPEMDPAPLLSHSDMGMGGEQADHDMGGMNMEQPDGNNMGNAAAMAFGSGRPGYGSNRPVVHGPSEKGPQIDMIAEAPRYQLDDPGIGLRNNGRRVLNYSDIFNLGTTPDPREPTREIELHLTGNMSRYMWSVNGIKFADAEPLRFKYGERLRINLINDTMMNHPMHLHGMWSDLETGDGKQIPRKHTVTVQPGAKISYLVTADAMGSWAYHCHLIYHMPGMFRQVIVG